MEARLLHAGGDLSSIFCGGASAKELVAPVSRDRVVSGSILAGGTALLHHPRHALPARQAGGGETGRAPSARMVRGRSAGSLPRGQLGRSVSLSRQR